MCSRVNMVKKPNCYPKQIEIDFINFSSAYFAILVFTWLFLGICNRKSSQLRRRSATRLRMSNLKKILEKLRDEDMWKKILEKLRDEDMWKEKLEKLRDKAMWKEKL